MLSVAIGTKRHDTGRGPLSAAGGIARKVHGRDRGQSWVPMPPAVTSQVGTI